MLCEEYPSIIAGLIAWSWAYRVCSVRWIDTALYRRSRSLMGASKLVPGLVTGTGNVVSPFTHETMPLLCFLSTVLCLHSTSGDVMGQAVHPARAGLVAYPNKHQDSIVLSGRQCHKTGNNRLLVHCSTDSSDAAHDQQYTSAGAPAPPPAAAADLKVPVTQAAQQQQPSAAIAHAKKIKQCCGIPANSPCCGYQLVCKYTLTLNTTSCSGKWL